MAGAAITRIEARAQKLRRKLAAVEVKMNLPRAMNYAGRPILGLTWANVPSVVKAVARCAGAIAKLDAKREKLIANRNPSNTHSFDRELAALDWKRRLAVVRWQNAERRLNLIQRKYEWNKGYLAHLGEDVWRLRAAREAQVNSLGMNYGAPFFKQGPYAAHLQKLQDRLAAWRDCTETGGENWPSIYAAAKAFCEKYPPGA
jgi:hypothetical protein